KAAGFYATWYPKQWILGFRDFGISGFDSRLTRHLRYGAKTSRRLARTLFHAMARFGPKLERQQVLLGRFVDIGTELFAIAASCARAEMLATREAIELADFFASAARLRIERLFRAIGSNTDRHGYVL